jgi:16S rRNA (uracil1498-N3)-methyltransferase
MSYPIFIGKKEGGLLFLENEEAHHAYVKRIKPGYLIKVNDLNGHIYLGKVLEISKKSLRAQFLEEIPVKESDLKINFYLCIPNHLSKVDELIPFITELGVYRFTPVLCENTAIKEKDVLKKIERWEKISINSIKQCERLFPVIIQNPVKIKEIVADADFNALFYEREKDDFLKNYCNLKIKTVNIIVGNEGGFAQEEVKLLKEKGFQTLSLSENILRMETAVITAVCQINFCFRN